MPNYQDGKIYKIVCRKTNLIYIGSTTNKYLSSRLTQHKNRFNNKHLSQSTSKQIIENNDYYIELVELVPCNSKDELTKRERFFIDTIECVNKYLPGRTRKEYINDNKDKIKEYRDVNKDKMKEWREQNKDKIKEQRKEYTENNKDKIKEQKKIYYEKKKKLKEEINNLNNL